METRAKFRKYDTDDSGSIDRDELVGLLRALHLEKYIPAADAIEKVAPPKAGEVDKGILIPKDPTLISNQISMHPESLVEGQLKQLTLKGETLTDALKSMAKVGFGAIASMDVPHVGDKKKHKKENREWVTADSVVSRKSFTWSKNDAEQGHVDLKDIKRVTESDAGDLDGIRAFEVALRAKIQDKHGGEPVGIVYIFGADNAEEREEWIETLKLTILQECPHQHQ